MLDAMTLCQSHHQNPRASEVAERHLFQQLKQLSESLGGVPYGDDEIKNPAGWPALVRVALMDLASDLEALVGNQPGRWGLRDPKEPTRLRWPSFLDIQYLPFNFGSEQIAIVERMRQALSTLKDFLTDRGTGEEKTPTAITEAPARKYERGKLDEQAAIRYTENPALTFAQLAKMLECSSSTLRNRKRCPLLAAARDKVKANRNDFYRADSWSNRLADED
jgi:hypothetical protein